MVHSTSALVVTRSIPGIAELRHVTDDIASYVQVSDVSGIPFARACALNSLPLAQRIWDSCPEVDKTTEWTRSALNTSTTMGPAQPFDAHGKWSLAASLRCDRHYHRDQFRKATVEAAKHGNVELLQWIFEHFAGCLIPVAAAEEAARRNHRSIIQYLLAYEDQSETENSFSALWRVPAIVAAGEAGHTDLVLWMTEGGRLNKLLLFDSCTPVVNAIAQTGDLRRLKREANELEQLPGVDFAADGGNLEMVEWIVGQNHTQGITLALKKAAAKGHFQFVEWLVRNEHIYLENEAVIAAAANGHLDVVLWLVERAKIYDGEAFDAAVRGGQLEMAKYLHAKELAKCTSGSMCAAAETGRLDIVHWLYSTFADTVDLFQSCAWDANGNTEAVGQKRILVPVAAENTTDKPKLSPMDAAAEHGHLSVLEYFRDIELSMQAKAASASSTVGDKRKRDEDDIGNSKTIPECTDNTMRLAIAGGHVDVVQWLRKHYHLEPAKNSIDVAAKHGRLAMVKWLHKNTSCGCTTAAMDDAAAMGHFPVVRWLHENRSEGCTTSALPSAAVGGHFDVVLFLYYNRSEGCGNKDCGNPDYYISQWSADNNFVLHPY